ncbi:MAG: pyridoxal phosphate-dependent aminotransferase [Bacillota bacterium]|nr:pyridoxal phosphate-dependent aminotransferase [Bacillota bacterium]MDW7684338.1 pyridoxal phosphate-dependent aminotransferase [Bacillota bacterium]
MMSNKALSISPSPTLAIDAKAKQMKSEGIDVIGFGAGEPDFDTPEHIKDAAITAIREGFTKYTPVAGTPDLLKAICAKLQHDNGLTYQPADIVVSNGAKHSLCNAFAAILNPGDEVIIPAPYWVSYSELVKLNDGVPIIVLTREENNFKITPQELSGALSAKTKAILINSPNNPTGQVYSREELEAVAAFAVEHNLYVISDEIYEKLIYGSHEHVSIASFNEKIKDLTIIINGVSKSYSMTGWRIGYTASNTKIAKVMSSIQSHATSNANSIAQKAALAALTGTQDCVAEMNAAFAKRRDYMVEKIASIPGLSCIEPTGAFYVFMNVAGLFGKSYNGQTIETSDSFATLLLGDAKVAVVPGTGFGAPEYVRLSYALSMENIQEGLDRIENFIKTLQ